MRTPVPDRVLFLWLLVAGWVGVLAGIPFTLALLEDPALQGVIDQKSVWLNAVFEALLQLATASAVGVWLGKRVGLGPRLPAALASRQTSDKVRSILGSSSVVGLALGVPAMLAEASVPEDALGASLSQLTPVEWLLRSLSAAVTEEIAFRLGLMTLFVWLLRSVVRKPAFDEASLWIGNALSALLFGAAHLPPVLRAGTGGADLVVAVLVFNTAAGMLMGWLYQSRGLVSAMGAHFVADAVRVIPLVLAVNRAI